MRVLLLGLIACASTERDDVHPTPPAASQPIAPVVAAPTPVEPPSCIDDAKPYDAAILKERVTYLASKELDGRAPDTDGDRAARTLIEERFRCLKLTGAGKDGAFQLPFEAEGKPTANVVAYIQGSESDEIIYVGAHHDHEGKGHLGANDNASGVAGLLAVAQAIKQQPEPPKRTIVFATFGGEELGMLGSYHLAAHPPAMLPNDKVVQFINLDMIGTHNGRGFVAAMGARTKLASRPILDKLARKFPKISVAAGGVARGSDYEPLCKQGVPYVFFWTPDPKCYHEACDTADRLDYRAMADIAALAGALTWEMANTDRDLAAARRKHGCGV